MKIKVKKPLRTNRREFSVILTDSLHAVNSQINFLSKHRCNRYKQVSQKGKGTCPGLSLAMRMSLCTGLIPLGPN